MRRNRSTGVRRVHLSERGARCGESNPKAKLTDHEVELIRQLRELGLSLKEIAEKFDDVSIHCIKSICCFRRRIVFSVRTRRL